MYKRVMKKKYQDLLDVNIQINKEHQELVEKTKRFKQKIEKLSLLLEKEEDQWVKSLIEIYLMEDEE